MDYNIPCLDFSEAWRSRMIISKCSFLLSNKRQDSSFFWRIIEVTSELFGLVIFVSYAELLYGLEIDLELKTIFIRILSEIAFLFKKKADSIYFLFWSCGCVG